MATKTDAASKKIICMQILYFTKPWQYSKQHNTIQKLSFIQNKEK